MAVKNRFPNAKSINLNFSEFHLPNSVTTLYIYNPTTGQSLGGYNDRNNKGTFNNRSLSQFTFIY